MNTSHSDLDAWLAGEDLLEQAIQEPEEWIAGFDADRQVVLMKLGPFQRVFLRPQQFSKRFYHQIYPLHIQTWPYRYQVKLFDDFCTVDVSLQLRFQATLSYVQKNLEILEGINQHIQTLYGAVLQDKINQELHKLSDGSWIQHGLTANEKRIALSVFEVLTQQSIQAEAICTMHATFVDFPDVQLGKESVYLHMLKKTYELNEHKNQEILRQQKLHEQQALSAKQQALEHLKQLAEMQRHIQLAEAEAQIQLLQDREQQIARQREVELRLRAEEIEYEQQLKKLKLESDLQSQHVFAAQTRQSETEMISDSLAHQALLEEAKTVAEIQRKQRARQLWSEFDQLTQSPLNPLSDRNDE
ncbi:MAG: hypothetical protein CTY19_02355 [Methylomonas sp.]|nr:MAG: hypothetical protein CTY19_02355 [Methylomonas sp.]